MGIDFLELLQFEDDKDLGKFVRSEIKASLDDKMTMENAVKEIYHWQHSDNPSWFTAMLLALFNKADNRNRIILAMAYPEIHLALKLWERSGDFGNDLFREYGLIK